MARPREFDEGEVLDAVVSTFWSRGFEATSIQDLVEATGLSRASPSRVVGKTPSSSLSVATTFRPDGSLTSSGVTI